MSEQPNKRLELGYSDNLLILYKSYCKCDNMQIQSTNNLYWLLETLCGNAETVETKNPDDHKSYMSTKTLYTATYHYRYAHTHT